MWFLNAWIHQVYQSSEAENFWLTSGLFVNYANDLCRWWRSFSTAVDQQTEQRWEQLINIFFFVDLVLRSLDGISTGNINIAMNVCTTWLIYILCMCNLHSKRISNEWFKRSWQYARGEWNIKAQWSHKTESTATDRKKKTRIFIWQTMS